MQFFDGLKNSHLRCRRSRISDGYFLWQYRRGAFPFLGRLPRRIFVYIAAILVYKATDTAADTEQGKSRFARALQSAMTEMKRSLST